MDNVNTKIGQSLARENASMLTQQSFVSSNLVGMASGVSEFTKSENAVAFQQVNKADKALVKLPEQSTSDIDKKLKANSSNADTDAREEYVSFSQSLSNINELLQTNGTKLSFTIQNSIQSDSENSGNRPVVIVTDKESGNVIRQIPSEEVQAFAERLRNLEFDPASTSGLVVDGQA